MEESQHLHQILHQFQDRERQTSEERKKEKTVKSKVAKIRKEKRKPQQSLLQVTYKIEVAKNIKPRFLNPLKCFRTEQEVYLTLDEIEPSGFGEIPLSPLSLSSKPLEIKYFPEYKYLEVSVLPLNFDHTPIELVVKIFEGSGDQEKKRVAENLKFIHNFHQQPQQQITLASSFEEILSSIDSEYYKIYVIDLHPDRTSKFAKVLMSEKLLILMGTNRDMFTDFVLKETRIPDAFSKLNYLHSWNEVMEASYQFKQTPKLWVTTFEGINISTTINIKIDFFYDHVRKCISMVSQWVIKLDQDCDALLTPERILSHSNEYFEKKYNHSKAELDSFKEMLGISKKKLTEKCCGYKLKSK